MEFILHLPQNIDKDGALWQIWNSFNQNCKNCHSTELHGNSLMDASSLLLFAAHHQINSLCSALKVYDLDLPKLNNVLKIVEQACMPSFILLFERFRYFNLKHDISENVDDFVIILRQQAEICEFGSFKDSIMTNALNSSLKSESLIHYLSNTDGLNFDNFKTFSSESEGPHGKKVDNAESTSSSSSHFHNDKQNSKDSDISSCTKFRTNTDNAGHSVCYKGKGKATRLSEKNTEKLKSWKQKKIIKHKRVKKLDKLVLANPEIQSTVADYNKNDEKYVLSKSCNKTDSNCSRKLVTTLINTKGTVRNDLFFRFNCCCCEKTFYGQNCLRKHLLSKHAGCTEYSCKICISVFLDVEEYILHYKNVHVIEQQKSHPTRASAVKLRIKKDIRNHCSERNDLFFQFNCCCCEKTFYGQNCLRKHLLSKHAGCTEYSCKICTSVFLDVEEYILHYKNAHFIEQQKSHPTRASAVKLRIKKDIRRYHCSLCRRSFIKKGHLRMHVHCSHPKSFMCWSCEESFQSLLEYKQHSEKHVVKSRFSCDLCQRQHHSIFSLIGHMKKHLLPQNKCDICGVAFIKQESLAKHIKKHIDEPAHKCPVCGKIFLIEYRLQYHMKAHSGEKKFTCELCGKSYTQRTNLVHHKLWHAGERPFECEICGKRTRCSGDLSKHKKKHSDKYSYVCEVCGRGFNYSSALVKHRMGHTGKRSFVCDVCGRTFIYREGLTDHIKASRCPGKRSESGCNKIPRVTKLLQTGMSNLMDVESKVHSQTTSGTSLKEIPDCYIMVRSSEADGSTSVVLVPSFS